MPIIDLQRRLVEVGRIRMGEKVGNRPSKLETFRLTSRDRTLIDRVAELYGGEVKEWNDPKSTDRWEVVTTADALPIMLIPGQPLSQFYEMWSGGGCQRRCDGVNTITPDDGPCLCPADHDERAKLAQSGKACKATTRLSVMLPDVPGIGCWRLESKGYYAAVELAGMSDLIEHVTALGVMLPARLRLDQRASVKAGQTRKYAVPVIDLDATAREVHALTSGGGHPQLEAPSPQRQLPPAPPAGDSTDARAEPSVNGAGSDDEPHADESSHTPVGAATSDSAPPSLSESQRRYVFRLAREAGLDDDALRAVIERVTGQSSTAGIPVAMYDELKRAIVA